MFTRLRTTLLGLCRYRLRRRDRQGWGGRRLILSSAGLAVNAGILAVTVVGKFLEGGWVTLLLTGVVVALCQRVRAHYASTCVRSGGLHALLWLQRMVPGQFQNDTSRLVFGRDKLFTRLPHNQAALAIQRRLHFDGLQMIILPMKV